MKNEKSHAGCVSHREKKRHNKMVAKGLEPLWPWEIPVPVEKAIEMAGLSGN